MIEQMSQLSLAGKSVIDFGTGTAVLAIMAEKLGADKVLAIDYDEWSISNARENVEANHCEKIDLLKADTIPAGNKADMILANINLNIILANLDAILAAANPGADILFSGILSQDEYTIIQALSQHGFRINSILKKDNWLAIVTTIG
jgi:ribosomal protein L11 methyltransferase